MRRLTETRSAVAAAPLRLAIRVQTRIAARLDSADHDREAGMAIAEYAVGTVAACGFGGVLYKVVTSPQILDVIKGVIGRALKLSF